jgi:hypothetical protein
VLAGAHPTSVLCLTVAVENVLELSDGRRDLQPEVEDLLLALETDVCGPSHHARQVALGLDVLTDTEVLGALLEEGVLSSSEPAAVRIKTFTTYLGGLLGASLALREGRGRRFLGLGCHLIVEAVIERETISECSFTK